MVCAGVHEQLHLPIQEQCDLQELFLHMVRLGQGRHSQWKASCYCYKPGEECPGMNVQTWYNWMCPTMHIH